MNTPDKLIIPNYSPISAKGGSKKRFKKTFRNKKTNRHKKTRFNRKTRRSY